jgi:hypothetical protein
LSQGVGGQPVSKKKKCGKEKNVFSHTKILYFMDSLEKNKNKKDIIY